MQSAEHTSQQAKKQSKILQEIVVYEGKWLGIKEIVYSIGDTVLSPYESAYRTTSAAKKLFVDGVEIVPIISSKHHGQKLVLITNFRPPIGKFCLQFPAGLAEDTDYESNALRELSEETGYVAHKVIKLPRVKTFSDPWKSNQSSFIYVAKIDGDDPHCLKKQELQQTQNIRVHLFDLKDTLLQQIAQFAAKEGCEVESKVWNLCLGMLLASQLRNGLT